METVEEYKKMGKNQQDDIKDVGGFVGGHLKEGRRKSGMVLCRSMLTLDMDYGTAGIAEELEMLFGYQMCIYSTHKHTPDEPRFRLIIPLSREVSEEEYPAVGRMVAKEIGIDMFDDTTYQPQRLMYWPSVSMNGEFVFKELEGDILNPDDYLAMYDDWHDISTHPTSSRQSGAIKKDAKTQEDPLEKAGIVGAFCRTYGIRNAIDKFLKDVYEPSVMEDGYDYILSDSSAGVTIYDEKFSYSFHATDPACGMLLNAFDVVRVHLFLYFIGNSDLLRCKKKHMSIEHMLDRTVFQEHKTDGQGFRRYKSLLLQNRHQMGHPHLRNNPYREGHPRSCGECPRMSCPPVDYLYLYIFCVVSLRLGS